MRNLVIGLGRTRAKARRSSARVEGCKEIGLDDTDAKAGRSSARLEGVHGGVHEESCDRSRPHTR